MLNLRSLWNGNLVFLLKIDINADRETVHLIKTYMRPDRSGIAVHSYVSISHSGGRVLSAQAVPVCGQVANPAVL